MAFGQIISEARKKKGLSQKQLAEKIKKENGKPISPQYLNDLERDRRNPPPQYLIFQFAEELDLPKNWLLGSVGTLASDLKELIEDSDPRATDQLFKAFRRKIKKSRDQQR
jgi:transcriptional regulator with XRE-family HTH domain